MKKMKKLLQRALVFTLAVTMLVGTPMTASAFTFSIADLISLFSLDADGNVWHEHDTSTCTHTDSDTTNLGGDDVYSALAGIGLEPASSPIIMDLNAKQPLKASLIWNEEFEVDQNEKNIVNDEFLQAVKWESTNTMTVRVNNSAEPKNEIMLESLVAGEAVVKVEATLSDKTLTKQVTVKVTPGGEGPTTDASYTSTRPNKEVYDNLDGIYLKSESVEGEKLSVEVKDLSERPTLTVALKWKEGFKPKKELTAYLLGQMEWKSSDPEVVRVLSKAGVADTKTIVPLSAGKTATVVVSLVDESLDYNFNKKAQATVIIGEEYAKNLGFKEDLNEDAYTGSALDLNEYVVAYVVGTDGKDTVVKTSEKFTYALKDNNKLATLKNDVLTLKKEGDIYVKAIGKNVESVWTLVKIQPGNDAQKFEFLDVTRNTFNWEITDQGLEYKAKVKADPKGERPEFCTNQVTWTSSKPEIVTIKSANSKFGRNKDADADALNECSAVLEAKAVGTAKITAKASNGKKAVLTVKVTAKLTEVEFDKMPEYYYSGQTIDLNATATQHFKQYDKEGNLVKDHINFTDAAPKWKLAAESSKGVTLNAKGVLTVKADVTNLDKIKSRTFGVVVTDKKGQTTYGETANNKYTLRQAVLTQIQVSDGRSEDSVRLDGKINNIKVSETNKWKDENNKSVQTVVLPVGDDNTYNLTAVGKYYDETDGQYHDITEAEAEADIASQILGFSASGKSVKAERRSTVGFVTSLKKGTATINVTGTALKDPNNEAKGYKVVKASFKVKSSVPATDITLSVKNTGITVLEKDQKIGITAKFNKGATTKNGNEQDIEWNIVKRPTIDVDDKITVDKKGTVKLPKGTYSVGDEITVSARVIDGPTKTLTLKVVEPSKSVIFMQGDDTKTKIDAKICTVDKDENGEVKVTNAVIDVKSMVVLPNGQKEKPGDTKDGKVIADVTYTVNKPGVAHVIKHDDGKIEIQGLSKGTATIIAKTEDGRTGKLTVKVN